MATWLKLGQWFRKQKLVAVLKPWGKSLSKRKQEKKSPAMERHRSGANAWLWIKAPPGRAGTGTTQSSWNLRTLDQWGWEGDPHELGSPPPVYSTGKCAHHEPHECLTSSPLFLSFLVATSYQGPRILSLRVVWRIWDPSMPRLALFRISFFLSKLIHFLFIHLWGVQIMGRKRRLSQRIVGWKGDPFMEHLGSIFHEPVASMPRCQGGGGVLQRWTSAIPTTGTLSTLSWTEAEPGKVMNS